MSDSPNSFDMRDIVPPMPSTGTILIGTVGWDDSSEFFDQGKAGSEEDGYTLVRVQCLQGHNFLNSNPPATGFSGRKILCHISDSLYKIPQKGDRVYVAIPAGQEGMDCAGVIFAGVSKSPFTQFGPTKIKLDAGTSDLVIKGNSVTLSDNNNNYFSIANGVVKMALADGTIICLKSGNITGVGPSGVNFQVGSTGAPAGSSLTLGSSSASMTCGLGAINITSTGSGTWLGLNLAFQAGSIGLGPAPAIPLMLGTMSPSMYIFGS